MHRLCALLVGAACAMTLAPLASAADLQREEPIFINARPPAFAWSGCYLGLNTGVAFDHANFATTVDQGSHFFLASNVAAVGAAGTGISNGQVGFTGGAQAGCNWQRGSLVFGLEGDFNGLAPKAEFTGNATTTLGPASVTNSITTSWLATVRPRVGYAPYRALVYVTGGAAFARLKFEQSYSEPDFPASGNSAAVDVKAGWTIGAGYEYAFANNWSARAEYLYARFNSATNNDWLLVTPIATSNQFHGSASNLNLNLLRIGLNYKLM